MDVGQVGGRPRCWQCGTLIDGWAGSGSAPGDGDYSVCAYCTAFGVYVATPYGLTIRRPTAGEGVEMDNDPDVLATLRTVRRLQR
jgi:hypothetical protein